VRSVGLRVVELAGWIVVAVVGAVMLTQATGWSGTRIVAIVQSLTPHLAQRWLRLTTVAAAVAFGALVLSTPMAVPDGQPAAADGAEGLRVAAVNLLYSNERIDEVAVDLDQRDPDVVVFTEYTVEHQATLEASPLADRLPHRVERIGLLAGGIAVWSSVPVEEAEHPDMTGYSIDVSVQADDGDVRLVAVHPPTPTSDFDSWRADLRAIREIGATTDQPTLVAGDFNASYWHPAFRELLDGGFVDAHIAAGRGFSVSWPVGYSVPPFVRLDRALTVNGLVSTGVEDFTIPGSDHRGFVVTVAPAR
jgi:endonuclease/exonuclease/phosphatase (EEP) superfamily protein YafD